MGKKGKGGGYSSRGGRSNGGYSPGLNVERNARSIGRRANANRAQELADKMIAESHARPASKQPKGLKRLSKTDSAAVGKATSAKRPSKAQKELALAAAVRKTLAKHHRAAARG